MTKIDPTERARLRALLAADRVGAPCTACDGSGNRSGPVWCAACDGDGTAGMQACIAARNALPALLDALDAAERERDEAEEAREDVEERLMAGLAREGRVRVAIDDAHRERDEAREKLGRVTAQRDRLRHAHPQHTSACPEATFGNGPRCTCGLDDALKGGTVTDFEKAPSTPHEPACSIHGASSMCDCDGPAMEIDRLRTALAESQGREAALVEAALALVGGVPRVVQPGEDARRGKRGDIAYVCDWCDVDGIHRPSMEHTPTCALARVEALLADPSPAAADLLARAKRCDEAERGVFRERESAARAVLASTARLVAEADALRVQNHAFLAKHAEYAASEAATREAYERDERVACEACAKPPGHPPYPRGYVFAGPERGWEPCAACREISTIRAPLPDPSPAVAALLAARDVAEAALGLRSSERHGEQTALDAYDAALARYEAARAAETKP